MPGCVSPSPRSRSLDSFDCATQDICGVDGEFLDQAGDCAAITAAVEQACPGSGTTGGSSTTW